MRWRRRQCMTNVKTKNTNLAWGEAGDAVRTATSCFDPGWNILAQQEGIFHYWYGQLPGHVHVNRTYPDVVRIWRQFPWWFPCIWRVDRATLYFSWKTAWCSQEIHYGQDAGKHIEDRNQNQIADLRWQRSLNRWWWHIQETQVAFGGHEVGRRKGAEELVVTFLFCFDMDSVRRNNQMTWLSKGLIIQPSSLSDYQRAWQSSPKAQ